MEGKEISVRGCVCGRWEERGKMCVWKVGGEGEDVCGEGGRRVSRDT